FASHFAPSEMMRAIDVYRQTFRPSAALEAPYVMLGYNAFVADSDAEAHKLFSSVQQAFVNLRLNKAGKLPMPVEGYYEGLDGTSKAVVDSSLSCAAVGAVDTVPDSIKAFVAKPGADELMVTSQIWDPQARV